MYSNTWEIHIPFFWHFSCVLHFFSITHSLFLTWPPDRSMLSEHPVISFAGSGCWIASNCFLPFIPFPSSGRHNRIPCWDYITSIHHQASHKWCWIRGRDSPLPEKNLNFFLLVKYRLQYIFLIIQEGFRRFPPSTPPFRAYFMSCPYRAYI